MAGFVDFAILILTTNPHITISAHDHFVDVYSVQVIGPIDPNGMLAVDFESLCGFETQTRVGPVVKAIASTYDGLDSLDAYADLKFLGCTHTNLCSTDIHIRNWSLWLPPLYRLPLSQILQPKGSNRRLLKRGTRCTS